MPDFLTTTTYWLPPTAVQYDRTGRKAHAKVLRDDYAEGTGLYPMQGFMMASDQVCCVLAAVIAAATAAAIAIAILQ
jgi:hypothetical protein